MLKMINNVTDISGMSFDLCNVDKIFKVKTQLIGDFNVSNLLAVATSLLVKGIDLQQITGILSQLKPVVGRMEAIKLINGPLVVVDFAHTPDALDNALTTLKHIENRGKLYCVFGCGGNRDKTKRPIMGRIASTLADSIIITSDNPRFEEPLAITADIVSGVVSDVDMQIIADRKIAILQTIANASAGDIILIAGKGHENYQEINGQKNHFSDQEIVLSVQKNQ